jgi:hypothetical protein
MEFIIAGEGGQGSGSGSDCGAGAGSGSGSAGSGSGSGSDSDDHAVEATALKDTDRDAGGRRETAVDIVEDIDVDHQADADEKNICGDDDDDDVDDDDNTYYDRLQSYVDGQDDNENVDGEVFNDGHSVAPIYTNEEAYFSAMLAANSIESNLVLPEDSMIWQFVMRDIASSTLNKGDLGFMMVGADDLAVVSITRQWLFNHLPISANLYCLIGFYLMDLLPSQWQSMESNESGFRLWVNDVTAPTIAFSARFPQPNSDSSEITVDFFYDPSLVAGLGYVNERKHLIDWKSVCKEMVATTVCEWERIRFLRDECASPSNRGVSLMFAGVTRTFQDYFCNHCGIIPQNASASPSPATVPSSDSKNWRELFVSDAVLFVADPPKADSIILPEGYEFSNLR